MSEVRFSGISTTGDGSEAVVWVETHISQAASAYPITPVTNMGYGYQVAVANGRTNLWGETLAFMEPESEHSAGTVAEGFAVAGGRIASFTASQGLVLQKEVLYTIAGKCLPAVFNIGARAITSQGLSVHAGHRRLGDTLKVRIEAVNPPARQVDFALMTEARVEKKSEKTRDKRVLQEREGKVKADKKVRRVVGPPDERSRAERPVRVTIHRMYFGEWSSESSRAESQESTPPRPQHRRKRKQSTHTQK